MKRLGRTDQLIPLSSPFSDGYATPIRCVSDPVAMRFGIVVGVSWDGHGSGP
jgi:hypothetical protein